MCGAARRPSIARTPTEAPIQTDTAAKPKSQDFLMPFSLGWLPQTLYGFSPGGSTSRLGEARVYDDGHMYGASVAFATANLSVHLRGQRPQVLAFKDAKPTILDLDLGPIAGPPNLGPPARAREMGIFNPSLAPAPAGLCPRCSYVAALRVDPLHQCHGESPLLRTEAGMPKNTAANAWFKGTAIAILDINLHIVKWTWLLNAPQHQVSMQTSPSRWFVPVGSADKFPPPWAKAVYDVRAVAIDGRLFVSYVCRRCDFSIAQLQLTGVATPSGGLSSVRAWQSQRYTSTVPWVQGRNQALFVAASAPGQREELMVQPWLGIIGSFGAPTFRHWQVRCGRAPHKSDGRQSVGFKSCGASPIGAQLDLVRVDNDGVTKGTGFGRLRMVANNTAALDAAQLHRRAVGGFRLSTTSNLVRITGQNGCVYHLGVGHVHRSEGKLNLAPSARVRRRTRRRSTSSSTYPAAAAAAAAIGATVQASIPSTSMNASVPFMWGYHYTHFFYVLEPHGPFGMVATSGEFCLESAQLQGDCESIQFISGIALQEGTTSKPELLLSYGVNDCEAKVGRVSLESIWSMLIPLPGMTLCAAP